MNEPQDQPDPFEDFDLPRAVSSCTQAGECPEAVASSDGGCLRVRLGPLKEFDVLSLLASHPGRVYSREQIMRHLWNEEFFGEARAADVHVQHIRKKIEPDPKNPRYVHTVRGAGYKFADL